MKIKIALLFLFIMGFANAQDWNKSAKDELEKIHSDFTQKRDSLKLEKEKYTEIANKLTQDPKEQFEKTLKLKKELDDLYKKRETFINFYLSHKIPNDSLISYFPEEKNYKYQSQTSQSTSLQAKTTYYLFGDKQLIKEDDLIKNEQVNKVFSSILSQSSESNLGKLEIPATGQKIPVYFDCDKVRTCSDNLTPKQKKECQDFNKKCEECKREVVKSGRSTNYLKDLIFEEVNITITEGVFEDVRVTLIDEFSKEKYYFENRFPISILRNTRNGKHNYLHCSFVTSIDSNNSYNSETKKENCYLTLKDILQYYPNSGNNFVPDDQNLILPVPNKDNDDTVNRRVYQLIQDTSLQNIVELRTYTDFLGLFGSSPNGVVQIEGKAEFFISPFVPSNTSFFLFKKIAPYANFTKIDDTNRGLTLIPSTIIGNTTSTVKRPLEILEKSYLEMGFLLNIASFKFTKETPFKTNFYFPLRYNATFVNNDKANNQNLKMVGYGLGLNLEFKRFSNFGFNYSVEFTNYNPINQSETVVNPSKFWVFRNEAELFYYPGKSKNQSIFTRFRTFYNTNDDKDSFFQFQFGYRFSIGAGNVKSKIN